MNSHVGVERFELWHIFLTVGAPNILVAKKEVLERGENHAVDINVEKVDDVVEGRIVETVGFFSVKLDNNDKDIIEQCEEVEIFFELNNLSQGENISSVFSTKAGKCVPVEAFLFDECVDGPFELDEIGNVDQSKEEIDA